MRDGKQPMSSSATSTWTRPLIGCFYAVLAVILTAATPATSQEVGAASKVVNKVLGKSLGYEIRTDQKINFREEINTLAKSGSTVSFKDGTALSIGEDSQMTIDEFVYDPASGSAKGAMRVVKGVLRFATDAPQLSAIRIAAAQELPVPLAEPLNARIAYNENVTSRVSSSSDAVPYPPDFA